ncbi:MAG TPA: alpha/beta hydrolase [Nitrosopumilaceae archaeon]|nr:alpha/beta hydrolase [Nitrosopumilaceae archaeon]
MQEKFINVDEYKIRYLESGTSDSALVLIHGLGASAERWEYVIPFFNRHFRVIVPDLIGFGSSDKPLVDYTMDFFSEFLKKFIDKLEISKPIIIGSSLGGQITAEFTAKNNISVKKLVLVSPSGIMKNSTPALDAYVMAALYPNPEAAKNAFEMMSGSSKNIDPKIIEGFVERMQRPNAKMAFMSTLLGLKNSGVITEKLSSITVPTMIVWGGLDPVIPVKYADAMVSAIKDCRFFRMDGCGHTPYVEDPQTFVKIVMEFLGK